MASNLITNFSANDRLYADQLADAYATSQVFDTDYSLSQDPLIYLKVMRDPTVNHAASFRRHLVAADWQMVPGAEDDASKQVAAIFEEGFDKIHRFGESLFDLANAIFMGTSWAAPEGRRRFMKLAGMRSRFWFPDRIQHVDKRRFRLENLGIEEPPTNGNGNGKKRIGHRVLEWQLMDTRTREYLPIRRSQFIHHTYNSTLGSEQNLGFGAGLISALYSTFRAKQITLREMLQGMEKLAQGAYVYSVDTTTKKTNLTTSNSSLIRTVQQELEKNKGRHIFVKDKADDLSVMDMPSSGSSMFQFALDYFNTEMTTLILGSTLPTGGGPVGSLARAEVQERSTESLVRFDRRLLSETIQRDLIGLIWKLNRPNLMALGLGAAAKPIFELKSARVVDPKEFAAMVTGLLAQGVKIREDEFYEGLGLSPPQEGDKVVEGAGAAPPGGGLGGLPF